MNLIKKTGRQPKDTKHIFDVESRDCQRAIEQIIHQLECELITVNEMWETYDNHPFLNDIQPESMQRNLPASLDEWSVILQSCIDDWKELLTK